MKQHKWHKEIKAWANGEEIEDRVLYDGGYTSWQTIGLDTPDWNNSWHEYRIKPQPKEPKYLYVYESMAGITFSKHKGTTTFCIGKIKLEDDE